MAAAMMAACVGAVMKLGRGGAWEHGGRYGGGLQVPLMMAGQAAEEGGARRCGGGDGGCVRWPAFAVAMFRSIIQLGSVYDPLLLLLPPLGGWGEGRGEVTLVSELWRLPQATVTPASRGPC